MLRQTLNVDLKNFVWRFIKSLLSEGNKGVCSLTMLGPYETYERDRFSTENQNRHINQSLVDVTWKRQIVVSDEGLNRSDETRALTWQQWLQSKRGSGRGNSTNNTVEEKTDLLGLGTGQEEHAGPCTQTQTDECN